ncbi:YybH family protein [Virgibacillus ndiopensis]|uniref:YybH family protein n=1 Tax=Virgibacillus ndiopensis TaxID=2004408 RepID=UPI000C06B2E4|nr:nuclear transport factor 2 family protein [Virgibacillus ndiopensis]
MAASTPQEALKEYEKATNSHLFENVSELIDVNAIYYFSDETVHGHEQLKAYFEKTWDTIQDEVYTIKDVNWIALGETIAVCIYQFHWIGNIGGNRREGSGRGTNVFKRSNQVWKVIHEHLSIPN